MPAEPLETPISSSEANLALPPAAVDFTTYKTQLVVAAISVVLLAIGLNYPLLSKTFTPSESRFLLASCDLFAAPAFFANLSNLLGIEPGDGPFPLLITGALAAAGFDSAIWQHAFNLLLLTLSAILVGQIVAELSSCSGNRLGAAAPVWAGLIFLFSPWQIKFVVSLSMRAELCGQLLFLYAVFAYLRFRATGERKLFRYSLLSAVFAFFSRPEAALIPAVITVSEVLLPASNTVSQANQRKTGNQRFVFVVFYWLALSIVITTANLAPDLVPVMKAQLFLEQSLKELTQLSWLFPMTGEQMSYKIACGGYALIGLAFAGQCLAGCAPLRVLLLLCLWFVSAPLMQPVVLPLILSLAGLPTSGPILQARARPIIVCGLAGLTLVSIAWFHCLHETTVYERASLPLKPPSKFVWPHSYKMITDSAGSVYNAGLNEKTMSGLTFEPADVFRKEGVAFSNAQASITPLPDALRIFPGKQTVRVWLPATKIDPKRSSVALLKLLYTSKTGCHTCHSESLRLIWRSQGGETKASFATISDLSFGKYFVWLGRYADWTNAQEIKQVGFEFEAGDYFVDLGNIELVPYAQAAPSLVLLNGGTVSVQQEASTISSKTPPELGFDVRQIPKAAGIKVVIYKANQRKLTLKESDLYSIHDSSFPLAELDFGQAWGRMKLPGSMLSAPGSYEIKAVALSADRGELGLPSEPWLITVTSK